MSYRRSSGGNNNRSYSNFSSGITNPWQGGLVSTNPAPLFGNNTGDPNAQLALALTNLLKQQPNAQVPSLLNMAPVNPVGMNSYGRSSYGYDNYDRRDMGYGRKSFGGDRRRDSNRNRGSNNRSDKKKDSDKNADKPESEEDKKRDWKGEQNDEEDETKKESKDQQETKDDEPKIEKKRGYEYEGIPRALLRCFVCQKHMWDSESFDKHIKGRAHHQMLESMEDSYALKANMIRANIRLTEEKYVIELERMQRLGKKVDMRRDFHCNMCDYNFIGLAPTHRKSSGHLKLKKFLHPSCKECDKEFANRGEWLQHRLEPEHFKKMAELLKKGDDDEGIEVLDNSTTTGENEPKNGDDENAKFDSAEEDLNDTSPDDLEDMLQEDVEGGVILDLEENQNLANFSKRTPSYNSKRPIGKSLVSDVPITLTGQYCEPCRKLLLNEEMVNKHLCSLGHYEKFINLLTQKYIDLEKKDNERKRAANDDGKEEEKVENGDDGNWKRRKVEENENDDEAIKKEIDETKYDPQETGNLTEDESTDIIFKEETIVKDEKLEVKEEEVTPKKMTRSATKPKIGPSSRMGKKK